MRARKHHTKHFGDLGLIKIMADLAEKGWSCFLPVSEHLAVDLIATKRTVSGSDKIIRIQAKYAGSDTISKRTNNVRYDPTEFDYFAVYMASVDAVVYLKSEWSTSVIATEFRKGFTGFYWWEDFRKIQKHCPVKRTYADFGYTPTADTCRQQTSKIEWPDDDRLQRLILKHPLTLLGKRLGVSDTAIRKRAKSRSLVLPASGYWQVDISRRDKLRKKYWKQYLNQ